MDDSAAGQHRPSPPDDPRGGWTAALRRGAGALRDRGARWRRRSRSVARTLAGAFRQAVRYYLSGGRPRGADRTPARLPDTPGDVDRRARPRNRSRGRSAATLAEAPAGERTAWLPDTADRRPELPAADGRLQVDRTPERLTLSDPDREGAYLSSTVWVDPEE